MESGAVNTGSPWFTIWTDPRGTIRRIVDTDPRRHVIALVVAAGLVGGLNLALSPPPPDFPPRLVAFWPLMAVVDTAAAVISGIIGLYVAGALLRWAGGLLGGVATRVEVRAAIAWSMVPGIALEVMLAIRNLIWPAPFPIAGAAGSASLNLHLGASALVVLACWIYVMVVHLKCLGEVHRFSAWRALAAVIIGWLAMLGILIAVGLGIALITMVFGVLFHLTH